MDKIVNMHEAKTNPSRLVDRAMKGEDVVVARAGRPVVRLVPVAQRAKKRRPGLWKGRVKVARDFDKLPKAILDAFEGKSG